MPKGEAGKDFVTLKEILRITREGLGKGRTRQEIYEELLPRHDRKEYIAQIIASIPEPELKAQYRAANLVLVILLGLIFVSNLLLPLLGFILRKAYPPWVLTSSFALVCTLSAPEVYRMSDLHIYGAVGWLTLVGVAGAVPLIGEHAVWALANLALFGLTSGLAFYVGRGLRSDWTPADPVADEGSATTET
jgi:hypothetical protein